MPDLAVQHLLGVGPQTNYFRQVLHRIVLLYVTNTANLGSVDTHTTY